MVGKAGIFLNAKTNTTINGIKEKMLTLKVESIVF